MKTSQIEKQREKGMEKKKKATEYPGIIRIPNINKQPIIRSRNWFYLSQTKDYSPGDTESIALELWSV